MYPVRSTSLTRVTAPPLEPLTLDEAKAHCRVDGATDDALLTALVQVAREWCEGVTERALVTQTWRLTLDAFPLDPRDPCAPIRLPRPPLQAVTSVQYVDATGATQTLDPAQYVVEPGTLPGQIRLAYGAAWPMTRRQPGAVTITYTAGYGAAATDVPAALRQAMLLMIGDLYANREAQLIGTITSANPAADALIGGYRYREAV